MQRWVVSLLLAAAFLLLLAAVILALLPNQADQPGWRSVNGEVSVLLERETGAGGQGAESVRKPSGRAEEVPAGEEAEKPGRVNINEATAEQLTVLPGIGPAKAGAIVAYRETYGKFETPEQLMEVKGIGPKTFARLKDLIEL